MYCVDWTDMLSPSISDTGFRLPNNSKQMTMWTDKDHKITIKKKILGALWNVQTPWPWNTITNVIWTIPGDLAAGVDKNINCLRDFFKSNKLSKKVCGIKCWIVECVLIISWLIWPPLLISILLYYQIFNFGMEMWIPLIMSLFINNVEHEQSCVSIRLWTIYENLSKPL